MIVRFADLSAAVLFIALGSPVLTQSPEAVLDRGVAQFERGQFAASAASFGELAKLVPDQAPHLWQRGIALYYAGRYTECRHQFESHRTVNPDDVENAAWHFLCVAREKNAEAARAALLPVGPDSRRPMLQVYDMFRGKVTPDAVMRAAGNDPEGRFYGNLYVGLYYDALGREDLAVTHIRAAAAPEFRSVGGYMHMVATVHLRSRFQFNPAADRLPA